MALIHYQLSSLIISLLFMKIYLFPVIILLFFILPENVDNLIPNPF